MPKTPSIEVVCPTCETVMTVDSQSGEVIFHKEPKKKPLVEDISEAVQSLKKDASRREDIFNKSLAAEHQKEDLLQKKFEEAVKKAKEDPNASPPTREIDLD